MCEGVHVRACVRVCVCACVLLRLFVFYILCAGLHDLNPKPKTQNSKL